MRRILFAVVAIAAIGALGYLVGRPGTIPADTPERDADTLRKMFPDGLEHDFGKVTRGEICKHSFRIVNTSNVQLRIVSLRMT